MMIGNIFIANNWVADGVFAGLVAEVEVKSQLLTDLIERVKGTRKQDVELGRKVEQGGLEAYEFNGYNIPLRCQRSYINILTRGCPEGYTYQYAPLEKVICVFDEDGLIGFVMRLKNKGEE